MIDALYGVAVGVAFGIVLGAIAGWKLAYAHVKRTLDTEVKNLDALIDRLDLTGNEPLEVGGRIPEAPTKGRV